MKNYDIENAFTMNLVLLRRARDHPLPCTQLSLLYLGCLWKLHIWYPWSVVTAENIKNGTVVRSLTHEPIVPPSPANFGGRNDSYLLSCNSDTYYCWTVMRSHDYGWPPCCHNRDHFECNVISNFQTTLLWINNLHSQKQPQCSSKLQLMRILCPRLSRSSLDRSEGNFGTIDPLKLPSLLSRRI